MKDIIVFILRLLLPYSFEDAKILNQNLGKKKISVIFSINFASESAISLINYLKKRDLRDIFKQLIQEYLF